MSRRQRLPSWVGDEDDKPKAKPIKPLADRIDPLQAKLNDLDELELELDRDVGIPCERRAELRRSIIAQRHAIHKRIDKRDGVQAEPEEWQSYALPWHAELSYQMGRQWCKVRPCHFWLALCLFILLALKK